MDGRLPAWTRRIARRLPGPGGRSPGGGDATNSAAQVIDLDYAVHAAPRWGYGSPAHPELERLIAAGRERYRAQLEAFLPLVDDLRAIPLDPEGAEPGWHNDWYQGLDAVSLYGFLALTAPKRYVEIGSGQSTRFARRCVRDHELHTEIVSVDPAPRAEIDALCDRVVRTPLEDADQAVFRELEAGDILFVDGSHRCFQNSDATVVFTELLPRLAPGVLVQVHDVFLPWDYPPQLAERHYSEHYLLAAWLLADGPYEVVLPNFYLTNDPELHGVLEPLWRHFTWSATPANGSAFWMRRPPAARP